LVLKIADVIGPNIADVIDANFAGTIGADIADMNDITNTDSWFNDC